MSFGFGVGDFLAVRDLARRLYKNFRGVPGEFTEIGRQLASFHIVLVELEDDAADKNSLLNRRGVSRREELLSMRDSLLDTLRELDDLFQRYSRMGRNAWQRFRLGQQNLADLRQKLTLHINVIETFVGSLTMAAVGRMEPAIEKMAPAIERMEPMMQRIFEMSFIYCRIINNSLISPMIPITFDSLKSETVIS
jgi:hypothetical protein